MEQYEKIEILKDQLQNLDDGDLLRIWNDWCENCHYEPIQKLTTETLVEHFNNDLGKFLLEHYNGCVYFNLDHEYFTIDGYGHIETFDYLEDKVDYDDLADWIDNNDLYDKYWDVLDLDEFEEEEEEEDE